MCFVVFRASGRGGLVGHRDLGVFGLFGVWGRTEVGLAGVVAPGIVAIVVCFPQQRRVTGMKVEVADA